MAHRIAASAERDLDDIWLCVARESSRVETADHLIETITSRFLSLANFPYIGRSREEDFGPRFRSFAVEDYVIFYFVDKDDVLVLRVVHGRRSLEGLL
jgi:toxin ParE1/3/4